MKVRTGRGGEQEFLFLEFSSLPPCPALTYSSIDSSVFESSPVAGFTPNPGPLFEICRLLTTSAPGDKLGSYITLTLGAAARI